MAINLPRRKFLQHLAKGTACLAILSPTGVYGIAHRHLSNSDDLLSFTDLEGLGPEIKTQFTGNGYVALHEEHVLPSYMVSEANRHYVEWLLRDMVEKKGLHWDATDRLVWTYQYYGICDHSIQCYRLLEYSMSAQKYLYSAVHGLLDINVKWDVLSENYDYAHQKRRYFNGFVGRFTYLVNRVNLVDKEGVIKDFGLVSATPVNRAINYIKSRGNIPNASLMYLIPGNTSLVSPFSELLHITTHGPSQRLSLELERRHNKQQAKEISHIIGETVTESAALLLAQRYLEKRHLANRMTIIDAHARYLGSRYALMPTTFNYMLRHGVEETLSSYCNDPLNLAYSISGTAI